MEEGEERDEGEEEMTVLDTFLYDPFKKRSVTFLRRLDAVKQLFHAFINRFLLLLLLGWLLLCIRPPRNLYRVV